MATQQLTIQIPEKKETSKCESPCSASSTKSVRGGRDKTWRDIIESMKHDPVQLSSFEIPKT